MSSGPSLLSRIFDRVVGFASLADGARRVRYRRAELRRIPAVEMVATDPSCREPFEWRPAVRVRGRSHDALTSGANARVTYEVVLPPHATVSSWCALSPETGKEDVPAVEFEIRVRTESAESFARCLVGPRGRRWHPLRVSSPGAGPARIVLTTKRADGGAGGELCAMWGSPRIETPRPAAELLSALRSAVSEHGVRGLWHKALPATSDRLYRLWMREQGPSSSDLRAQRQWSQGRARLFSLITFAGDRSEGGSRRTAASVHEQSYPGWEWILITDGDSSRDLVTAATRSPRDERVRVVSAPPGLGRAAAWNAALAQARGEFAAILGSGDVLAPSALYEMARELERRPENDVLYSDEDRISSPGGRRHDPHFKPDWSPELLLASNYIGRFSMLRVSAVTAAGGFRPYDDAEEWELLLRLSRRDARVRRVPRCLYHRATAGSGASRRPGSAGLPDPSETAGKAGPPNTPPNDAVRDHCLERGLSAVVTESRGGCRVIWPVNGAPTVSVIIPNRNAPAVLKECLRGLLNGTDYPHREIIIVDNGSTDPDVLEMYRSLEREGSGRIVPFDRPFNFSAACNAGAAAARGELLLFLNNDIEVIEPDWLEELVRWSQLPAVGIVGAKLLYPDRTIQHAGVAFGLGLVGHIFSRAPEGASGVFGSCESYRNYLAVTGACQMIRKEVFQRLGGFDERFRLSFSDVVLCMEAWKAGYRVVYTPHARLVHHESYTRKRDDSAQDMELLARYLRDNGFAEDPFFHPELNPRSAIPAVRPPFDPTPRQVVGDYVDRVLHGAAAQESGHR